MRMIKLFNVSMVKKRTFENNFPENKMSTAAYHLPNAPGTAIALGRVHIPCAIGALNPIGHAVSLYR